MATTTKRPPIPRHVLTLVDLDSKLALFMGERLLSDEPVREISYRVSTLRLDDDATRLKAFVGLVMDRGGWVYLDGRHQQIRDTDAWTWTTMQWPIRKPKDGKDHTWVWVGQTYSNRADEREGWRKQPFPRCSECYEAWRSIGGRSVTNTTHHNPAWTPAGCGQCHPDGVCDERGFCRPIEDDRVEQEV